MKVGLIAVDGHSGFPNLALMKLSSWHKKQGDSVEWALPLAHYDRVYMSKVFTFTPDMEFVINADEVIKGGTGYGLYEDLPEEVEKSFPDYSLYPTFDGAIGFLTRGCINQCEHCIVPRKEGYIRPAATWQEIKRPDNDRIIFLDNNVLACQHGIDQIADMGGKRVWVDFNQGMDAMLIDKPAAKLLADLRWIRFVRVSCDTTAKLPYVEQAVRYMIEAGIAPSRFWSYVLVRDIEDAHHRVLTLQKSGVEPFAQPYRPYDGSEPTAEQKRFARWVNNKAVFNTVRWEEYKA